jgi:hypothetical protein
MGRVFLLSRDDALLGCAARVQVAVHAVRARGRSAPLIFLELRPRKVPRPGFIG